MSPAGRVGVGLTLLLGPIAALVGVLATTGSAVWAASAALTVSPLLQLSAEAKWPLHRDAQKRPGQLRIEIFQGIVYGALLAITVMLGLWWLMLQLRAAIGIQVVLGGGLWVQAIVLVVLADFLDYFRHRHEHESSGVFWRVHSVHHSIRGFTLLTGLAIHPLETLFTYFWYGVLAGAMGLSFEAMLVGFALALIVMGAQHTNTDSSLGWLSYVFAHTDGHRWHHDLALESGRNVNYANVLTLWDLLWGSYYAPRDFDREYGIRPFWDEYPKGLKEQLWIVSGRRYKAAEAAARFANPPTPQPSLAHPSRGRHGMEPAQARPDGPI